MNESDMNKIIDLVNFLEGYVFGQGEWSNSKQYATGQVMDLKKLIFKLKQKKS